MDIRDFLIVVESYCAVLAEEGEAPEAQQEEPSMQLLEDWIGVFRAPESGRDTFVFANPSAREFRQITHSHVGSDPYALLSMRGDLFIWNSSGGEHDEVRDWLQQERKIVCHDMKLQMNSWLTWMDLDSYRREGREDKFPPTVREKWRAIFNNRYLRAIYDDMMIQGVPTTQYADTFFMDSQWFEANVWSTRAELREGDLGQRPAFVGWIDEHGGDVSLHMLAESTNARPIIEIDMSGDEFIASWREEPTLASLERLAEMISENEEFEAYRVGAMIFPLSQQAKAAVGSLARGAQR